MNINCEDIVEKYLLNQNPLYAFSFPISILIAIIVFGICKAYKISENSYVNQILIPITALLLVIVIIDILSRFMISKNESNILLMQCKNWKNNKVGVENFNNIEKNNESTDDMNQFNNMELLKNNELLDDADQFNNMELSENMEFYNNMESSNDIDKFNNMDSESSENIESYMEKDNIQIPISEINGISPSPLNYINNNSKCIQGSNCCSLCSDTNNPCNIIAPIPGPQWLPQSAKSVQDRLSKNKYTPSKCNYNK
jgi:hypothetical protein